MVRVDTWENRGGPEPTFGRKGVGVGSTPEPYAGASTSKRPLTLSVIIKALNEERHIASAIESALAAVREIDAEVILADGGSTDRTIEIARRYPIVIVQLNRMQDRSCGSGAQLGFQYSRGRYLLLMDGDMQLDLEFPRVAIETLVQTSNAAGVGGIISEPEGANEEYKQRNKRQTSDKNFGRVTRLDCSGLYRRAAIESIGYLTDRNLHGAEEFDLGARLHCAGWTLVRIERPHVYHETHTGNAYRLLLRHVFSGRASAPGELVRAAMEERYLWPVMRNNRQWLVWLGVTAWWIMLLATIVLFGSRSVAPTVAILLLPVACMSLRWRSFRLGLYSIVMGNATALCFLPGLLRARIAPASWIESTVLQPPKPDSDHSTHQLLQQSASTVNGRGPEHSEI
jgi:Glycosyl transferase family 2